MAPLFEIIFLLQMNMISFITFIPLYFRDYLAVYLNLIYLKKTETGLQLN